MTCHPTLDASSTSPNRVLRADCRSVTGCIAHLGNGAIKHDARVVVQVQIDARDNAILLAALDNAVVEVDVVEPNADLPSTRSAFVDRVIDLDPAEGARFGVVVPVLPGQEVAEAGVAAPKVVWIAALLQLKGRVGNFRLKSEWAVDPRKFAADEDVALSPADEARIHAT